MSTRRFLGDRTPEEFLDTYWQEKPLLVRDAVPDFRSPLSPEELAGLACEADSPSRLILEEGGSHPWELREGPFDEDTFLGLPERHWSLLVQEVDRRVPAVHDLLDLVSFLPRWRVDDVMVSYAPDEGSVGAHLDRYDVFLLQGLGRRRWQIEADRRAPGDQALRPDLDVQILTDFDPDHEWVLEPGDVLYLPPRVPHYGIAEGDCMTYSIGFRAPSYRKIAMGFMQELSERAGSDELYADPGCAARSRPGRIAEEDLERVGEILSEMWERGADRSDWFGRMITTPGRGGHAPPPDEPIEEHELLELLRAGRTIRRSEASRFAYREAETSAVLYVDGTVHELDGSASPLAELLGERYEPPADRLRELATNSRARAVLTELYNDGHLYLPERP